MRTQATTIHRFKIVICLAFMFLCAHQGFTQKDKIDWNDDVITVNGQPYAKMVRKTPFIGTYDYSISGFTGPELIYIKAVAGAWVMRPGMTKAVQEWNHEVNFIGSGSTATIQYRGADHVAKTIYEHKLIMGNALDPDAERRFIQLFNGYTPSAATTPTAAAPSVVVNVNNGVVPASGASSEANAPVKSKSPVKLEGSNIMRDGASIGKYREGATASTFSQKTRLVTVYNVDGEKVAEADAPTENPQEWTIRILSDGKVLNLLYDAPGELEALFKWLADKGYLSK
jgi:hypothetical protein